MNWKLRSTVNTRQGKCRLCFRQTLCIYNISFIFYYHNVASWKFIHSFRVPLFLSIGMQFWPLSFHNSAPVHSWPFTSLISLSSSRLFIKCWVKCGTERLPRRRKKCNRKEAWNQPEYELCVLFDFSSPLSFFFKYKQEVYKYNETGSLARMHSGFFVFLPDPSLCFCFFFSWYWRSTVFFCTSTQSPLGFFSLPSNTIHHQYIILLWLALLCCYPMYFWKVKILEAFLKNRYKIS